jgi:hypothetical protein
MATVRWTRAARRQFDELQAASQRAEENAVESGRTKSSKAEGLFNQVCKTVRLLSENPRHPGLQTHEYYSLKHPFDPKAKVFEAYVQQHTPGAYRLFWCYGPGAGEITIIAITPHP